MPRARSRQAEDSSRWDAHKVLLRDLYLEKNQKLEQVMDFMAGIHRFYAE
jgi:hypothetical protein